MIWRLLSILVVGFWITGAAHAEMVLHRGNAYEPTSLDPQKISTVYEDKLVLDIFEGLTAFTPDGKAEPAVAESWSVSADGMTWTFKLRPGLRWSDGSPITADDVVFSFRRLFDPKTAAELASSAYDIANGRAVNSGALAPDQLGVAAPDAHTVVVHLENPAPYLPELLAHGHMCIVPRAVVTKFGDGWIKPENVVSNGAFVLKEWVPSGYIAIERNPMYRAPAKLDKVIYEPTQDLEAAVTRFRAGGLDMQFEFTSTKLEELRRDMPAETKAVAAPLVYYVPLNIHRPKLADVRVRRALSLAIDRDLLANRVMRGGQVASETWIPAGSWGYQPPTLPWQGESMAERLDEAKKLLAAVGIGPKSPLRLVFSFTNTLERKRVGVALAAMWKPLGIILTLQGTDGKVLFADLRAGDFDVAYVGWSADFPDPVSFLTPMLSTSVAGNYSRYNNPAYDEMVRQAALTTEPAARHDLLRQAELMLLNDQPIIPLFRQANRELVSTHVHGWEPNPDAVHLSRYLTVDRPEP